MKGYPKQWNTKKDVQFSLECWPEQTKDALQKFLGNRFEWLIEKKLADGESGVEDETHRVREVTDEDGNVAERYQMVWAEDPNARLFRLGFTVKEVEELLAK